MVHHRSNSWFTSHQFIIVELLLYKCLLCYFKPSSDSTKPSDPCGPLSTKVSSCIELANAEVKQAIEIQESSADR